MTVFRHTIAVSLIASPNAGLRCALEPRYRGRWKPVRYHACGATTIYRGVKAGRYRLSVHSRFGDPARILRVPKGPPPSSCPGSLRC